MRKKIILILLILIIVSGCADKGLHKITIGNTVYQFIQDIKQSQLVPIENSTEIYQLVKISDKINIAFEPGKGDEGIFQVVAFNIVRKTQQYYADLGWTKQFNTVFLNETILPDNETNIWLRGPNTGATNTSVYLINTTIVVQGETNKSLEMAADRLSLTILGIDKIKNGE